MDKSDLCKLPDLDEEVLIKILRERFEIGIIYTSSGLQLLSINPYKNLEIYSPQIKELYQREFGSAFKDQLHSPGEESCHSADRDKASPFTKKTDYSGLQPHIYLLLEECLMNIRAYGTHSIIISGESGSGKTECARHILDYLGMSVMVDVDIIVESIGNARTAYNDNSSRFGKLVKLDSGKIEIQTFLLEKSRVTAPKSSQAEGNFHIFYYILAGNAHTLNNDYISYSHCDTPPKKEEGDNPAMKHESNLYHQSSKYTAQYLRLKSAFSNLKMSFGQIETILIAILNIGSIGIFESHISVHPSVLSAFEIDEATLTDYLLFREIKVKDEVIRMKLTKGESIIYRDSLAKLIYSTVFEYILENLNAYLGKHSDEKQGHGLEAQELCQRFDISLNILDIFGFENFDRNGLDQFCINWCNEKIYDEFVNRTFKEQQRIFKEEDVVDEAPYAADKRNAGCDISGTFSIKPSVIPLIEEKGGIVDLISEEALLTGSAANLSVQISKLLGMPEKGRNKMLLTHFAGEVEYDLTDFVERNSERTKALNTCISNKIPNAKFSFPWSIANILLSATHSSNIVVNFRSNLLKLFDILNKTTIKYVKCIKPNNGQLSIVFEDDTVLRQLTANGILQSIQLSKKMYPYSMHKEQFHLRYNDVAGDLERIGVKVGKSRYFFNNLTLKFLESELLKLEFKMENENRRMGEIIRYAVREFNSKSGNAKKSEAGTGGNAISGLGSPGELNITIEQNARIDLLHHLSDKICTIDFSSYKKDTPKAASSSSTGHTDGPADIGQLSRRMVEHYNLGSDKDSSLVRQLERYKSFSINCMKCQEREKHQSDGSGNLPQNSDYFKLYTKLLHSHNILQQKYKIQTERLRQTENRQEESLPLSEDVSTDSIELVSSANIFHCIINLYLDHYPSYLNPKYNLSDIPRDEIVSLANCIVHIVDRLEAELYLENIRIVIDNLWNGIISSSIKNTICKNGFVLSNLIELKAIMIQRANANGDQSDIPGLFDELINTTFLAFCSSIKEFIKSCIPDSILEHQEIKELRTTGVTAVIKESLLKNIFVGSSIGDFIKRLEKIMDICTFYYIPDNFIRAILSYALNYTDCIAFNSLLIKKNFMTFNRCAQISYNLGEIGKCCFRFGFVDWNISLAHITEAVKISTIISARYSLDLIDECFYLNEAQKSAVIMASDSNALMKAKKSFDGNSKTSSHSSGKPGDSLRVNLDISGRPMEKFLREPNPTIPEVDVARNHTKFVNPKYIPKNSIKSVLKSLSE